MELKKRKRREQETFTENEEGESLEISSEEPVKKKSLSRREMRDKIVMERYHESQRKQGILKKPKKEPKNAQDGTDKGEEEMQHDEAEKSEVLEEKANEMMDEYEKIKQEEKKKLKKDKKEFKKQQKLNKLKSNQSSDNGNVKQNKKSKNKNKNKEQEDKNILMESKQDKALSYLQDWKTKVEEWKFKKNFHIWLLKNWRQTSKIDDENFTTLLKYLNEIDKKSKAIERLESEAQKIVDSDKKESTPPVYERAREILQWLS